MNGLKEVKMSNEEIIEGNKLLAEFTGWFHIIRKNDVVWQWFTNMNAPHFIDEWYYDNDGDFTDKKDDPCCFIQGCSKMQFNTSWTWLMPVVEKIEALSTNIESYYTEITSNGCKIMRFYSGNEAGAWQTGLYNKLSKIESTWYNCVEFVKWFLQNKEIK